MQDRFSIVVIQERKLVLVLVLSLSQKGFHSAVIFGREQILTISPRQVPQTTIDIAVRAGGENIVVSTRKVALVHFKLTLDHGSLINLHGVALGLESMLLLSIHGDNLSKTCL